MKGKHERRNQDWREKMSGRSRRGGKAAARSSGIFGGPELGRPTFDRHMEKASRGPRQQECRILPLYTVCETAAGLFWVDALELSWKNQAHAPIIIIIVV